ncbi:MAG TPA: hypothetical protein VH916_00860, partial [Dehalococcoidia bacterium]
MIAILDTWPLADGWEEVRGVRYPPGVALLARFRDGHAQRAGNRRLDEALDGGLVRWERIHDCLGPFDPHEARCPGYGCVSFIEGDYDMSSHGLFVADVAKDVAPSASLTVYRVMSPHGEGAMSDIVQGMEAAIADARAAGMKLVINVSLGVGPPPWLAERILADRSCYSGADDYARFAEDCRRERERWLTPDEQTRARRGEGARLHYERLREANLLNDGRRYTGTMRLTEMLLSVAELPDVLLVAAA